MKGLTIEQKAKAYDEAIKRVENINTGKCKTTFMFTVGLFEYIFPELAESEDEKVRKALLEMIHDTTGDSLWIDYNVHKEDAIAWLEKRGQTFTKKDIDDAYLKGICDTKRELEKQAVPTDIPADAVLDGNKDGLIADTIRCKTEKQEWSEEDENLLKLSIENLTELKDRFGEEYGKVGDCIVFLESIKDRYTWRPSDKQMVALDGICSYIRNKAEWEISQDMVSDLYKLSEQLKKLKD